MTTLNSKSRICAILLLAALVSTLRAEPATTKPAEPDEKLVRLVADLNAPSPAVRDAATAKLMQLGRDELPELRRVIEKARPLSPGQEVVLHDVIVHVWLSEEPYEKIDTGFLGMTFPKPSGFDPFSAMRQGVFVASRMPGFAAYGALLDSDQILEIKEVPGVRFTQPDEFAMHVQSFRPGQTIHLVVLRHGQQVTVPIRLSSRPAVAGDPLAGPGGVDGFLAERLNAAEAYYEKVFAPLMSPAVSSAQ